MNRVWFTADTHFGHANGPTRARSEPLPLSHSYYDNALRVAVAIISNCGIRLQSGDGQFVVLDTLLINLDQVFERYIRNRHALHFHRIEFSSWD
jgi:hypothetical protein